MYGTLKAANALKNQALKASESQPLTQESESDDDGNAELEAGQRRDDGSDRKNTMNDDESTDDDLSAFTDENDSDFEERLEHELMLAKYEEEEQLLLSDINESGRKMNPNERLRYQILKRQKNERFSVFSLIGKYLCCCFCGCKISSWLDDCVTTLMTTVILPYYVLTLISGGILLLFIALQKSSSDGIMKQMFYAILVLTGIGSLLGMIGEIYYTSLIEKLNKEIVIFKQSNRHLRSKIAQLSVNRDRLSEFNEKLSKQRSELRVQTDRLIDQSPQLRRLLKIDRLFDHSESHLMYDFFVLLSLTRLNEWMFYVELFFDCCGITSIIPSRLKQLTSQSGHCSLLSPISDQSSETMIAHRSATMNFPNESKHKKSKYDRRWSMRSGNTSESTTITTNTTKQGWNDILDRTSIAPKLRLSYVKFRRLLDRLPNDKAKEIMIIAHENKLFTDFTKVTKSTGFWTRRISNKDKRINVDSFLDQLCEPLITHEIQEMSEELFSL